MMISTYRNMFDKKFNTKNTYHKLSTTYLHAAQTEELPSKASPEVVGSDTVAKNHPFGQVCNFLLVSFALLLLLEVSTEEIFMFS